MAKSMAREKGTRTKVGRASRSLGQSWQVPVFLVGVLVFGLVAASAPLRRDSDAYEFSCDLHHLREALQLEDSELEPLHFTAESLLLRQSKYPDYAGEIEFLAGSLYQRQAQQSAGDAARDRHAQAIKHLQKALTIGARAKDEPVLLFQLGQSFYANGDLPEAIDHLKQALAKGYDRRAAAYGLLVQAYLNLPEPNLEAALETNQKQLVEFSDEDALAAARLARGQILMKKKDYEEAYKTLERINVLAPKAIRAESRYLQTVCSEKEGWWDKAVTHWQELLEDPSKVPGGRTRVLYSLGVAQRQGGHSGAKHAEKSWLEAMKLGGEIGQASGLRLGELYLQHQKDTASALKVWSQVLLGTKSPRDYANKFVELAEARQMFDDAFHVLARNGDFAGAQELATLYQRLAVPGEADEKLADATAALARTIMEKANGPDADIQRQQAKAFFEKAAHAYGQAVASLPFERQSQALWRGAQCLMQAGDHAQVVAVLDRFVQIPTSDAELSSQAWLALGQAYQALNQRDMARKAYYKCIELPSSASAYEARYQIAEEELQLGKLEEAIDNLKHCLSLLPATSDSSMREKSLYKLANAYYLHKEFDMAQHRFKEALLGYPNNPEALPARDRLGECYRKLAEQARDNAKAATIAEETKTQYLANMRDWLSQALQVYVSLTQDLERRVISDPEEEKLLRKAGFMSADLHFELSSYAEALRRYQDLQQRHRRQFAGLVACLRIWRCVGVMVSPDQATMAQEAARAALQLTQQDLAEMPADHEAFRDRPGGWGKQEWQEWVSRTRDQLRPALNPPMSSPTPPPLPN